MTVGTVEPSGAIMLVEDDVDVRRYVSGRLTSSGYAVTEVESGERALELLEHEHVDLVLLDVGLPGIDGFAVLRAMRRRTELPVIMLTAATEEADRVLGLEIGADDYVVKPFLPRELIARVTAVLRRAHRGGGDSMDFGDVQIDAQAREVRVGGERIALTGREFDLLLFLASCPRQTFTREQLLVHVWNSKPGWQNVATVTEHIHRLRRRLGASPGSQGHLVTVRGVGYRFDP